MKSKTTVTLKDIAGRLGISVRAAAYGINGNGRLSPKTRALVRKTASEMGYVQNLAARSLNTGKSYLIGVMVPLFNTSFFGQIIAGIEEQTLEQNFSLLLLNQPTDEASYRTALQRMMQRNIDALIVYPCTITRLLSAGINRCRVPVIQIMNGIPELGPYHVTVDNSGGGRLAAEHLISLGHRVIGMITHENESDELCARSSGFAGTVRAAGISLYAGDCHMDRRNGRNAAEAMLKEHPEITAIFAASDFAALGALDAAIAMGRHIPDGLSLLGFDNLEIAEAQAVYPLSTIDQPKREIGVLAGKMVFDVLNGREVRSIQLAPRLVWRATTGGGKVEK